MNEQIWRNFENFMHLNPVFFWHHILLFFCVETHNNWQVSLSVSYIHRQRLYCLRESQSLRMFSSCFFLFLQRKKSWEEQLLHLVSQALEMHDSVTSSFCDLWACGSCVVYIFMQCMLESQFYLRKRYY